MCHFSMSVPRACAMLNTNERALEQKARLGSTFHQYKILRWKSRPKSNRIAKGFQTDSKRMTDKTRKSCPKAGKRMVKVCHKDGKRIAEGYKMESNWNILYLVPANTFPILVCNSLAIPLPSFCLSDPFTFLLLSILGFRLLYCNTSQFICLVLQITYIYLDCNLRADSC